MKKVIALVLSSFVLSAPVSAGVSTGGAALIGIGSFLAGFHTGNSHPRHEVREVRYVREYDECCDCDECFDCDRHCHVVVERVVPVRHEHRHRVYHSRPHHTVIIGR